MSAPTLRIVALDCFERPVGYRLPFRFGAATVTSGVQAFVRARIRLADGREAEGATAELMVPKWFDKDPARTQDDNVGELRASLAIAAAAYRDGHARTAFGHCAAHLRECHEEGARLGMPALAAAFGAAEVDRAVLDALCRALSRSFFDVMAENLVGFAATTPELAAFDAAAFLRMLRPAPRIAVRHTVGMADALTAAENEPDDGLPVSLEQAIGRYGLRWFKLKLRGEPRADVERLCAVAAVLDRLPQYGVTLDGNEQFEDLEVLRDLMSCIDAEPALRRLRDAVAFLEQPLPRDIALDRDVTSLGPMPLLIDESDASLDAFPRATARGYRGVSSKSCKGLYKSLVNVARCAVWTERAAGPRFFVSAEDLTAPAGLAVQQDTALAALLGVAHVERNGHHYIDGMRGAPAGEQDAFARGHPDLYERADAGVRLAIRDGTLALASLATPGFASAVLPDFDSLAPMALAVDASLH
jgi:hypothetical protein